VCIYAYIHDTFLNITGASCRSLRRGNEKGNKRDVTKILKQEKKKEKEGEEGIVKPAIANGGGAKAKAITMH
jgi:hypothetical protein